MVSRTLIIILGGLSLLHSASAELQLTPIPSEFERDGVKLKRLLFPNDEGKEISYRPPHDWTCMGSPSQLVLHPPDVTQAEAAISRSPLREPMVLDEATIKSLTDEALASVPTDSADVQILSAEKNPVVIQGKETFLITMSYTFYGETYGRSLMFMMRGKEQFRFRLACRRSDFDSLQTAFLASQFRWENL